MRHIQNKNDWFYELRPQLILLFGLFGLFGRMFLQTENSMAHLSQVLGTILVFTAFRILEWRKAYRTAARKLR